MFGKLKNSWKSWTIWFNGLLTTLLFSAPLLQEQLPQLQEYVGADVYKQLMFVAIIGNIFLRFKTNKALDEK